MIADTLLRLARMNCLYTAVLVFMPGMLWGSVVAGSPAFSSFLTTLAVWGVLFVATWTLLLMSIRRSDKALLREVERASPMIADRRPDHTVPMPAQIVRARFARRRNGFVGGYAPVPPPALTLMLSVIAPEGARHAIALAPASTVRGRARAHIGVRLDPAHPDVAVLDPSASPERMRAQYEAAMA